MSASRNLSGSPFRATWRWIPTFNPRVPMLVARPAVVITTPNKHELESAVGPTSALEIAGREGDLRRVSKAVEVAGQARRRKLN